MDSSLAYFADLQIIKTVNFVESTLNIIFDNRNKNCFVLFTNCFTLAKGLTVSFF